MSTVTRGVQRAGLLAEDLENAVDVRNHVMLETGEEREDEQLPLRGIDRRLAGASSWILAVHCGVGGLMNNFA